MFILHILIGDAYMNIFGRIVKQYLLDNDIKQQEIVDKMNVAKNTVSQSLNRPNVTLDTMLRIADALNCELEIKLVPKSKK